MSMFLTSVRSAVRLAPFLVLPLLGACAAGCGDSSPRVAPTSNVGEVKSLDESVQKSKAQTGAVKKEPAPKQRVGGGPG